MMIYSIFIGIIIVIALSYALTFYFTKKKLLLYSIIVVTLLWFILGGIGFKYLTSQQFKLSVDLKFKQTSVHNDLRPNGSPSLPLPGNTVFAYRYSETSASYFTVDTYEEVIIFFKSISNKESFIEESNTDNGKTKIDLKYENKLYSVLIYKSIDPKGYYLQVDSN
jgi:hypothetical protein